ncbi:ABC transporter ATP-binding protein [Isobaculum melis]|uniref:Energy-coupling factor transport system ATP-binding protein n=1 Tax=Isobaculum melis TaxID=142588 RepID=A0A1H9T391_9LACT|nr:ABC transporter ATP-binding protein [Isobaculum melis]SER91219.1 energy-coupling factor transport system ATP-binding protein [Isobaculum melis]
MIDLKNIQFAYDEAPILKKLDLQVKAGECIVLCGKSGCGKSTLLRILNGLIPELYEGDLTGAGIVFNDDFFQKEFYDYVKEIGVVFQNPKTQFFTNDVYSELAFSLENYGVERQEMLERIQEITEQFSLTDLLEKSMFHLSGGQKQLVAFASACMLQHRLFILDEPSSNLDEATIGYLRAYLLQLKEQGMTIILSEHRLHYLTDVADHYFLMEEGMIRERYTAKEMLAKSSDEINQLGLRTLVLPTLEKMSQPDLSLQQEKKVVLSCEDMTFHYRKQKNSLVIPSLTLTNEYITGIVGHNGAGKSTFSKVISGLLKPKAGYLLFNQQKITPKQLIAESYVVMQDVNLQLFFETVEKEMTVNAKEVADFEQVVEMLNLSHLLERHPQTLSGGEKQRVAIATALLSGKQIIIFDEPTSGLDLVHMHEISETIKWLHQKNILVLVITHDQEFLEKTCHRILAFEQGEIIDDYFIKNK